MTASSTISAAATRSGFAASSRASFGFSGAGFLTCYHLGVADCLLKHGRLLKRGELPNENSPRLTGVSGGALVAAAISVGVLPEDGMSAMAEIVRRTRTLGGVMDHLRPGFSLIDQVEDALMELTRDADEELVLRRIRWSSKNGTSLLRIGLTDSSFFPQNIQRLSDSYVYVDEFSSGQEILASCILSGYIPGLTGPVLTETAQQKNGAVRRATKILNEMVKRGSVLDRNGVPLQSLKDVENGRLWDGGLANTFPVVDENTCLVTPFAGSFVNPSISPSESATPFKRRPATQNHVLLDVSLRNLKAVRCSAFSLDNPSLESWFEQGHNDALGYVREKGMESSYSIP